MPKLANILHPDYRELPFWWEVYTPHSDSLADLPKAAQVVIVGAGYAGLATALELAKIGIDAVIVDAADPGFGASTRSGGLVGGSVSVKRPLVGSAPNAGRSAALKADADASFELFQRLIVEEKIDCSWTKAGRFIAAWAPRHFRQMQADLANSTLFAKGNGWMVPQGRQREEIGSDFYHGGAVVRDAGHVHPAAYYRGLLAACERRGVRVCGRAEVTELTEHTTRDAHSRWRLKTNRGTIDAEHVVIATNGYTGKLTPTLQRGVVPLQAYIITTEPLPPDLAHALIPNNRSLADTKRVVSFFRLSPDGDRLIFGSRVKWREISATEMAPLLYTIMIDRFPQLADYQITHAWSGNVALTLDEQPHLGHQDGLYYALGCNGSGVAMMTYLGTQVARKIAKSANYQCAFDTQSLPTHPIYNGTSRWFLPIVGNYLRCKDWIDRRRG